MTSIAYPELDRIVRDLLASNRGPGYDVSVVAVTPDHAVIDVNLCFVTGRTYCCDEPGCHIPRRCERLLKLAAEPSISLPDHVVVRWHCRVEQGTRLECHKAFGLPLESDAYEFEAVSGPADFSRSDPEPP
jgi:hypothetical protein